MSKSATIKSGARTGKTPTRAVTKPRFSTRAKVIMGAGAAILVLGGAIIAAMPDPGASKPAKVESRLTGAAGPLTAVSAQFNFGSVSMAAGKVTHRYSIRNTGTEPVLIGKMYTSCMCTTAQLVKSSGRKFDPVGMPGHGPIRAMNEPLRPGEQAIVEVVFDPAAHGPAGIGPIDRVVTIENNAGRPLELALSAYVTP